jgi:localization factor PodJL
LQGITDRIDTLSASQREPSAALDAIKSEIGSLRFEIAVKEAPPPPSTDHLETQIRDLAKQIETVAGGTQNEGKALSDLEAQVARLASELEQSKPQAQELKQVEERLERLQGLLADSAQESIVSARTEARKAVDDLAKMVAGNEIDAGLVRGLMRDLDSLRNAAGNTDDTTRTKLESVGQTMAQVVDRLSRLERETAAASQRAATETATYGAPPAVAKLEPASLLWRSGFRTAPSTSERRPAAPAPQSEKPIDRRADFIAAARRAAQAAAAEAASIESSAASAPEVNLPDGDEQAGLPAAERRPGPFARISQAIRNRKKPLLLAAAAIVLAIGAMQVFGKVTTVVAGRNLIAATDVATSDKSQPVVLGVTAANTAPTIPGVAVSALIPPPASPDTKLAFAAADGVTDTFGSSTAAPPADTLTPPADTGMAAATVQPAVDDQPTDAITTASTTSDPAPTSAPAATAAPDSDAGIVLASAEPPLAINASGLDQRLGPPKLLAAADRNDPAAEFEIATRYAEGSLVPKDLAEAAKWYAKAAEGGVAVAQYRLGSLYERGQGVAKDLTSAVNWYQRAADQGNVNAMHNLAVLMSEGADAAPDHDKALQWFLAAGNYGVRDSQYNLGVIYARGLGTGQDLVESYKWFAIAASQGDTDAAGRRDEVAKAMTGDDLAKARATVSAWHVKSPIAEANSVAAPGGGWDSPTNTLGEQDRQALVKKIQTLLADAGYDPGPADGVAGPKTVDAVRAYQRTVGVPDTGAIDKNLMASLSDGT